jgi:hypothetical protein
MKNVVNIGGDPTDIRTGHLLDTKKDALVLFI